MKIVIVSFVGINLALYLVLDRESLSSSNAVAVVSFPFFLLQEPQNGAAEA
jgi:hypothetical protein